MFKSLKNSNKGFTLIELLVVIAIIGILSSVVLASLSTARQKSRDAKRVSDIGQVQLALELYFDANQTYPSTSPNTDLAIDGLVTAGFIPKKPIPPAGGSATYIYNGVTSNSNLASCTGASCTNYSLGVVLERTDNAVLGNDADQTTTGTVFAGLGATCLAAGATDYCYDIKP